MGLALGGQALRLWHRSPAAPPGQLSLLPPPPGSSPRAHRDSSLALTRPLGAGERIDLDRAPAIEISRLPRVGLRLAKAIVADREARGPFGSLEALDRVPGIGPGLLAAIREQASFSVVGPRMASDPPTSGPGGGKPDLGTRSPLPILDLNRASAADLERLPKVGPALASRIVAFREKYGPFPAVDSLVRVPGIGPGTFALLRDQVRVE